VDFFKKRIQDYKTQREATAASEVPVTADEFRAADELDNEREPNQPDIDAMEVALEYLRGRHLAFRKPEKCEECSLDELRLEILKAVTSDPNLEDYYREAWDVSSTDPLPPNSAGSWRAAHRHVAAMQLELMMRAFYVLQLHLFANAPENHGWMALFRSWGRSARFNAVFDELAPTLTHEFRKFYTLYIKGLQERADGYKRLPIHHPWLRPASARGRGLYMDSGRVEPEIDVRPGAGPGGTVDQRGSEQADQAFEKPSDAPSDDGTEPPPNK